MTVLSFNTVNNASNFYTYDPLGRIRSALNTQTGQNETFAFDPAHNVISDSQKFLGSLKTESRNKVQVKDNRISEYNGILYFYDAFGNLIHSDDPHHKVLRDLEYDLFDRLVKATVWTQNESQQWQKEVWHYEYDALDRRVAKWQEVVTADETGNLKSEQSNRIEFLWDHSHLVQEYHWDRVYTYVYTAPDSYEPLAQIVDYTDQSKRNQLLPLRPNRYTA